MKDLTRCLALLLAAGLAGCGNVKPSTPPVSYGRESSAIGLARQRSAEQAVIERKEAREQTAVRDAEIKRQAVEADRATRAAPEPPTNVAPSSQGAVVHTVVMWFKTPGDETLRKQLVEGCRSFKEIPGVIDAVAGSPLSGADRPVIDASYDVAFTITLKDASALKAYLIHPWDPLESTCRHASLSIL